MNQLQEQPSGEITPDTHVRVSLNKALAIIGALVVTVAGAAAAWFGIGATIRDLSNKLAAHESNREVHIDPGYQFEHGRPVGKWDVDAYKAETTQAIKDINVSIDQLRTELVKKHRPAKEQ